MKKKVEEILDKEEDELLAYLCVSTPGIDDNDIWRGELRRISALLYRKPHYESPQLFPEKGEVIEKDKRKEELVEKYPELANKN